LYDALSNFMEKIYKTRNITVHKSLERDDVKKFKYEKAVQNIFENYFEEI
jgi:hypothetical protein